VILGERTTLYRPPCHERWALTGDGLRRMQAFLHTRHWFWTPGALTCAGPSALAPTATALLAVGRLPMLRAALEEAT
jgi:hypothetical protein